MRAVVRLLGEVAALPGGLMGKRCYLLDGLCSLSGATEWRWALFRPGKGGSSVQCVNFLRRNLAAQFSIPLAWPEGDLPPVENVLLPPAATEVHAIVSRRSFDSTIESRIALCRSEKDFPYTDREIHVASLVLDEIPWLHGQDREPRPPNVNLSPREQLIFHLLLLGLARKEIAIQLGISPGTVAGYIRNLYHRFGVNSQAELMRCKR